MLIDDLKQELDGNWVNVSARLTWEESDRPSQRIHMQVEKSLAGDVECNPNAFLVAAAAPAMYYGERRIAIQGALCPVLREGVLTVLAQLRAWYDTRRVVPVIESTEGVSRVTQTRKNRAAQFFSGGIDALATLRLNRLSIPEDHPLSIRDCFNVFGMHPDDYSGDEPNSARVAYWDRNLVHLNAIAKAVKVELHQLRTNVVSLFNDIKFFGLEYHSAIMLSLAHLLAPRISNVYLASSHFVGDLAPWGSHPLIDPLYGSADLRIHHDATRLRRLDKVWLVSHWPEALKTLNVCSNYEVPESGMNCGRCSKCVRTMIELLICGKLREASTFPVDDVHPEMLNAVTLRRGNDHSYFRECLDPLRAMGRNDLVAAVEARLADYSAWKRRDAGLGLKPRLKRLDEQLFMGWMRKTWRSLQPSGSQSAVL